MCYFQLTNQSHWHIYLQINCLSFAIDICTKVIGSSKTKKININQLDFSNHSHFELNCIVSSKPLFGKCSLQILSGQINKVWWKFEHPLVFSVRLGHINALWTIQNYRRNCSLCRHCLWALCWLFLPPFKLQFNKFLSKIHRCRTNDSDIRLFFQLIIYSSCLFLLVESAVFLTLLLLGWCLVSNLYRLLLQAKVSTTKKVEHTFLIVLFLALSLSLFLFILTLHTSFPYTDIVP